MDVGFDLDQFFGGEPLKKRPIVTQEKIKFQGEEEPLLFQEKETEENRIILNLKEEEIKSNLTLEVVLPIVSQFHFYVLHWPI